jgi:hypothetical protein
LRLLDGKTPEVQDVVFRLISLHPDNSPIEFLLKQALQHSKISNRRRAKAVRRNEDYPERNASIRADRAAGLSWGKLAKKHRMSIAAVRGVVRRRPSGT